MHFAVGPWVIAWFKAFVLTEMVEVPVVLAMTRNAPRGMTVSRRAGFAFFASLATHPAVWFIFPDLGVSDDVRIVLSEAWACVAEAAFYKLVFSEISLGRATAISTI